MEALRRHRGASRAQPAVPVGSICGFLGRNGAGKTTAIKVLLGMAHATSGEARVLDSAAGEAKTRARIGFVSDEKDLYDYMTVEEMIAFTRRFFPRWRVDLEQKYRRQFDLPSWRPIKELSRGMRTKLALLLALARGADLLILDEPTSGLDPAMAEEVLQLLIGLAAGEQTTVFFSSHQIAEVEQIADHIVIIDRGRAVVAGGLDDLRDRYQRVQMVFAGDAPTVAWKSPGVITATRQGRTLTVLTSNRDAVMTEARALLPVSIDATGVTLKDIFLDSVRTED